MARVTDDEGHVVHLSAMMRPPEEKVIDKGRDAEEEVRNVDEHVSIIIQRVSKNVQK